MATPKLSEDQARVLGLIMDGHNVFFTGNAGTGKSFLLERTVDSLREKYGEAFGDKVGVTATTGIASTHIGGATINSVLGIGAPNAYKDFKAMLRSPNCARIRRMAVLVVDECSMLSGEFLEEIEPLLREVRGDERPAGGLQLVFAGDFYQLPPVTKSTMPGTTPPQTAFLNFGYAFQCPAWQRCNFRHEILTTVFRQQDSMFVQLLDLVRGGDANLAARAVKQLARRCGRPLPIADGIKPTCIFSRNKDVDDMNAREMALLGTTVMRFDAKDEVAVDSRLKEAGAERELGEALTRLKRNEFYRDCLATSQVELAVGAQVMLLKNMASGTKLVNGSRGVVTSFVPKETLYAVRPELRQWSGSHVPVVRFANGVETTIPPTKFSSTIHGCGESVRLQVPLKLAWAITVHKSQGMTLDYVRVSLRSMFATGQTYVALSRARSMEGLEVVDYEDGCVRTDPAVVRFYESLEENKEPGLLDAPWIKWRAFRGFPCV